jgi:mitotic-spindle organizing protein 1
MLTLRAHLPSRAPSVRSPVLHEISTLLETGLDQETLAILLALCEQGVNPEALAAVVRELRREAAALRAAAEGRDEEETDPPVFS